MGALIFTTNMTAFDTPDDSENAVHWMGWVGGQDLIPLGYGTGIEQRARELWAPFAAAKRDSNTEINMIHFEPTNCAHLSCNVCEQPSLVIVARPNVNTLISAAAIMYLCRACRPLLRSSDEKRRISRIYSPSTCPTVLFRTYLDSRLMQVPVRVASLTSQQEILPSPCLSPESHSLR